MNEPSSARIGVRTRKLRKLPTKAQIGHLFAFISFVVMLMYGADAITPAGIRNREVFPVIAGLLGYFLYGALFPDNPLFANLP